MIIENRKEEKFKEKNNLSKENSRDYSLDYPLLKTKIFGRRLVYLDNAATAQKPRSVIKAITCFYETTNANIHRGIHLLAEKATIAYESARETIAHFIGAEAEEIIFTSGTTQSLNMLAQMLEEKVNAGDEIVLTIMEHHSNLLPWQELARKKKAALKIIPLRYNQDNQNRLDLNKAQEMITSKTKIVAFSHISNVLGTINPAARLTEMAHARGALAVLDAAQSVGHIPFDVRQLNCDFAAFSGHKMGGPTGIGVLYGKKELLENLNPVFFGGGMIEGTKDEIAGETGEVREKTVWRNSPQRFEAGTPNIAGAIGLAEAVKFLEKQGLKEIEEQVMKLTEYALSQLKEISGVKIIGLESAIKDKIREKKPEQNVKRAGIISFTIERIHPHDAAEVLNKEGIAVRAGHHCAAPLLKALDLSQGTTRVSFYHYNTLEDVDALIAGIKTVKKVLTK